eukprot:scaffold533_cov369-Prasinococcus_capsulatus_cf.AAC.10
MRFTKRLRAPSAGCHSPPPTAGRDTLGQFSWGAATLGARTRPGTAYSRDAPRPAHVCRRPAHAQAAAGSSAREHRLAAGEGSVAIAHVGSGWLSRQDRDAARLSTRRSEGSRAPARSVGGSPSASRHARRGRRALCRSWTRLRHTSNARVTHVVAGNTRRAGRFA